LSFSLELLYAIGLGCIKEPKEIACIASKPMAPASNFCLLTKAKKVSKMVRAARIGIKKPILRNISETDFVGAVPGQEGVFARFGTWELFQGGEICCWPP
jgi:hypothetical protein